VNVAYIVAAHNDLAQLERLLRRLAGPDTTLVVHVDRRAGDDAYAAFRAQTQDLDLHHLERHLGFWGGFGVVRATLKGIRHLVEAGAPYDYAILLSGQDYPLRPAAEIRRTLADESGTSFMSYFALPYAGWGERGGFDRIERWHLVHRFALHVPLPWRRRIPGGLAPYGGGRSWLLERRAVEYVDSFVRENPSFVRFFEHTLHPSELFVQTILLNSPLAPTIVNDHRLFVRWRGGASPATLTLDDAAELTATDCLFARKFDSAVSGELLDLLDERLDAEAHAVAR
jgi:hypothetical protein